MDGERPAAGPFGGRGGKYSVRRFFDLSLDLYCLADLSGDFLFVNHRWGELLGHSAESLEGRPFLDFVHPDDLQATLGALAELGAGRSVIDFRNRYRCADGSYHWIEWRSAPGDGIIYAAARDVTDKVLAEAALRASLAEQETLMRELEHRVKNSLMVARSLVALESCKVDDPRAKAVLDDTEARLGSMGLIYEKLYRTGAKGEVRLDEYLSEILDLVRENYASDAAGVALELELQPVLLDVKRGGSLGLLLTELATNSMKYAFPAGKGGTIRLAVGLVPAGSPGSCVGGAVRVAYGDSGPGLPPGLSPDSSPGFGLRLVSMQAKQLGAVVSYSGPPGFGAAIEMPLEGARLAAC